MRFREKLYRFMQGRNGVDELARFENKVGFIALIAALVFTFVSALLRGRGLETASTVFRILNYVFYGFGILLLIHWIWRVFSRNVSKRQAENTRFLYRKQRISRSIASRKQKWRDRKTHKYFRCPKCGQKLRAPRGKGKIRVTCSKCSNVFFKKT